MKEEPKLLYLCKGRLKRSTKGKKLGKGRNGDLAKTKMADDERNGRFALEM